MQNIKQALFTMVAILNECPVYSRVTVATKLFSISQTALSTKKSQPFKECKIIDEAKEG